MQGAVVMVNYRKENEFLNEQLKAKDKECSTQHEDKKKHFENEFSKKEKQQKTLENKLNTLKKQVENKNKIIEELQQENRSLKKKMKEGCKQCSDFEAEVKELHAQIEITTVQHQKIVSHVQSEVTDAKTKEENLHQEEVCSLPMRVLSLLLPCCLRQHVSKRRDVLNENVACGPGAGCRNDPHCHTWVS
ncbi:synaptonemal complex protein 1-like isoform X1 [Ranitomeya imitator]|uniref:synaptonemal complex protein 1-like isoform X1 n=1 Tax=Ranitomeya imitator TaxID=111125 RepID=UPI0037E94864